MFLKDLNTSEERVSRQVSTASGLGVMNGLIGRSAASVTQNVSSEERLLELKLPQCSDNVKRESLQGAL